MDYERHLIMIRKYGDYRGCYNMLSVSFSHHG